VSQFSPIIVENRHCQPISHRLAHCHVAFKPSVEGQWSALSRCCCCVKTQSCPSADLAFGCVLPISQIITAVSTIWILRRGSQTLGRIGPSIYRAYHSHVLHGEGPPAITTLRSLGVSNVRHRNLLVLGTPVNPTTSCDDELGSPRRLDALMDLDLGPFATMRDRSLCATGDAPIHAQVSRVSIHTQVFTRHARLC
jgi:hypothetical protein